jgi:hypothetical protein
MMNRILIVGDYNRSDFLYPAKLFDKRIGVYFIEHLNSKYVESKEVLQYGKVIFWKDFSDAYDLLDKIAPCSIVFYFLEAYNHVALNVAARMKGIPTYHLEHGVRFFFEGTANFNYDTPKPLLKKLLSDPFGFTSDAVDKFKNKRFYNNTLQKSKGKARECLHEFYKIRSTHSSLDTFKRVRNDLRWPNEYISFSPLVFEYHKAIEGLPPEYPVHFIGIPAFDHFAQWKNLEATGNGVLFVDQPLHELELMGWTSAYKRDFLSRLSTIVNALGRKLMIKPHPWNDKTLYEDILSNANVTIIENIWNRVIGETDTVIGFSSTLLMPFMAMQQVCCFTMEMHPQKGTKPYSYFFLDSGACHAVHSFEESKMKLEERITWHEKQKLMKENFIDKYMFRFDGKSSERLMNILLSKQSV